MSGIKFTAGDIARAGKQSCPGKKRRHCCLKCLFLTLFQYEINVF